MKAQKLPPIVGLVCICLLGLICYIDPIRNYPSHTLSMLLIPGEVVMINRASQIVLPLGIEEFIYPFMHTWIISYDQNITIVDYGINLVANVLYELYDEKDYYMIRNDQLSPIRINIKTITAPSPEDQNSYRNYLYIITGFMEVVILSIYTVLNGAVSLDTRKKSLWKGLVELIQFIILLPMWKCIKKKMANKKMSNKKMSNQKTMELMDI